MQRPELDQLFFPVPLVEVQLFFDVYVSVAIASITSLVISHVDGKHIPSSTFMTHEKQIDRQTG